MPYVVVVPDSYIGTKHTSLEDFLNLLALATACYVLDLRPCKVVRPAKGTATRNERLMAWRLFHAYATFAALTLDPVPLMEERCIAFD